MPSKKISASVIALIAGVVGTSVAAEIYQRSEILGAKTISPDDISIVCGELTGVEIDEADERAIERCLMLTGVFEDVTVNGSGDVLSVNVREIETRPGRVEGGIVWDSEYGLTSRLSYEQYNLLPDAFIAIRSYYSHDVKSYEANVYKENGLAEGMSFGLEVKGLRADYDDLPYSNREDLVEGYIAWEPDAHLRMDLGLGYRDHRLFNLDADASPLYTATDAAGPFTHVALRYRPDMGESKAKAEGRIEQYLWNLGTDDVVVDTRAEARLNYAFSDEATVSLELRGGLVKGRDGNQITTLDRYFIGGDNFRGFAPRGVGPADQGDVLGGDRYIVGTIEANRKIGDLFGSEVRGGIFADMGSVWGLPNTAGVDDSAEFRSSVGLTLTLKVGEMPVSLYIAEPLQAGEYDKTQLLGLSASTQF